MSSQKSLDTTLLRKMQRKYGLKPYEKRQVKSIVKKEILKEAEIKHHDTNLAINVSNSTFATDCTDMVQDNTDTSRNGDKVKLQSIYLTAVLGGAATAIINRIMLVQWHDNSADNSINQGDIFQFFTTSFDSNTVNSPLNIDQAAKFTVLMDRRYPIQPAYAGASNEHVLRVYLKKGFRKTIRFNEAVTSGQNKIYLLVFSDSTTAGALNGYVRVRYSDL